MNNAHYSPHHTSTHSNIKVDVYCGTWPIEVIAQFLLIWFQSRLTTRIIEIQAERLLPNWGPQDIKQGQKAGDQQHPILCSGAGEENQRHKEKGTTETLF